MYAIVEIAGQQFKVAKDQKVFVHRLAQEEGSNVSFDQGTFIRRWKKNRYAWRPGYNWSFGEQVVKHLKRRQSDCLQKEKEEKDTV